MLPKNVDNRQFCASNFMRRGTQIIVDIHFRPPDIVVGGLRFCRDSDDDDDDEIAYFTVR